MTRTYPVLPVIMPTDITMAQNGKLPASVLRAVKPNGLLHHYTATAYNCLQLAAFFEGLSISNVGTYRTYNAQLALFEERYQLTPTGRIPQVTRTWNGKIYYLKKGAAPSSSPGNSDHGLAVAVDIAGATGKLLEWLYTNAIWYGFTWAVSNPNSPNFESWHLQYVCGDTQPPGVTNTLKLFPQLDTH